MSSLTDERMLRFYAATVVVLQGSGIAMVPDNEAAEG